ncbi:chromate reductase [Planktotalea frisia]|jgi:chromate reductase|uniref:FMN-dependent NADPH-azoreductase n=1 Tax=Planktotalea frisia TaxID=696762 RepID=A0A1L9NV44_9RHOB|nr:NADPH-dependent FMN reductase [Planktotalea frisia]OJI93168.1 FMN-dependent NADPH-azoreductase [Planktotalea frisia]PZX26678.1 chromate reductase [Planktotalea frisia]
MSTLKILGISGSLREGSFNTQLMKAAIASYGAADVEIADLNLPLYDGDLEAKGIPDAVTKLGAQIAAADAIIVASPEYNKGISGVLKNALDWASRVPGDGLRSKPTLLIGAAAGRTGGETAYFMTRNCLSQLGAVVLATPAVLVAGAHNEFNEDGTLKSEQYQKSLDNGVAALRKVTLNG